MIPGVGALEDLANGFWYLSEGDHFNVAESFIASVLEIGDIAGGVAKVITGCIKIFKAVKFTTHFAFNIGNFTLGAYNTSIQICCT